MVVSQSGDTANQIGTHGPGACFYQVASHSKTRHTRRRRSLPHKRQLRYWHSMHRLSHDDVLERCEGLSRLLATHADEAESLRRLPPAVLGAVRDADLFPMVVPTSLGGHGLGIDTLAHSTRVLAHGCPASAWTISFLVMHSWMLGKFGPQARAEFFGPHKPYLLTPAPLAPTGTVTPVDRGYRVSGRWEWATGILHAESVMVHAVQTEPEFTTCFAVVPISEATIEDVWFTSGMRATGSNTVRLDDVFVPAHRVVAAKTMLFAGECIEGDAMAALPVPQVLALVAAAPALGAAEAAVDLFRKRVSERVLAYSMGDRQQDQPVSQARLGTAISDLAMARSHWEQALTELAACAGTSRVPLDRRMSMRLAAAATVRTARSVISTVCEGSGASIYFSTSALQRLQRDIAVLKGHVIFDWDRTAELAGRVSLGLPPRPTDMV